MAPWTWPNIEYLSSVTANDRYSLSTKLTGSIWDKLSSISSVFLPSKPEWQSCISWWNHVYIQYGSLNSTKICRICPLITVRYRIPQNSVKTYKFRGNGQIPRFSSKFRVPRKTVVPTITLSPSHNMQPSSIHWCWMICNCNWFVDGNWRILVAWHSG